MPTTTQATSTPMTEIQCKQALSALSTPEIHNIIDLNKFLKSHLWEQLVNYATQKISDHGDTNALLRLLSAFETSKMFKAILLWYCARAEISYQIRSGSIKFRSPEQITIKQLAIAPYLKSIKGTKADVLGIMQYSVWQTAPILE